MIRDCACRRRLLQVTRLWYKPPMPHCPASRYFPAVVCAEFDSPVDALRSLCVPHDEAMDLVAATAPGDASYALLARIEGGRCVAAIPVTTGRWAACHAYPEHAGASRAEAERRLRKFVRGKKRGLVGMLDARTLAALLS